jgi:hypothetical protein
MSERQPLAAPLASPIAQRQLQRLGRSGDGAYHTGALPQPFEDWFDESVVRDAHGAPLQVFHGSRAVFSTFAPDHAMTAGRVASEYGCAFYFTPDPGTAAAYASTAQQDGGEVVYPVYLSLQKPYVIDLTKVAVRALYAPGHDPAFLARLRAKGYDGILVVDEDFDGRPPSHPLRDLPGFATEIVVFEPAQIRSAIAAGDDLTHPAHRARIARCARQRDHDTYEP